MDAISNQAEAEERLKLNGNANEEFCQSAVRIKEGPKARLRQWILAIIVHMGGVIMAMVWSWSSTALPSLRKDAEIGSSLTVTDEAWVAAITFLAGGFGGLVMGKLVADKLGLKRSLQVASAFLFFGWILVAAAPSLWVILLGRFITGFFVAGVTISPNIVAELSGEKRRGKLNYLFDLMFCLGVLIIYVIGTLFPWKVQAYAGALVSLAFFLLLLKVPESPNSLLKMGKGKEAAEAIAWARDCEVESKGIEGRLNIIRNELRTGIEGREDGTHNCGKYLSMEVIKPIFLATALQFFLQVCGVVPIVCYAVDVFRDTAGSSGVHENVSVITLGAVNLIATAVALPSVDKFGRRFLFIFSEFFMTLTLASLAIFLYMRDAAGNDALKDGAWNYFTLGCFVVYITFYSFGVGPIPWVVMGEVFSARAKGFSSGVTIVFARAFGFLVMFYFKPAIEVFGQYGVYGFFAIVCVAGMIFVYFFIPETKGEQLEHITERLKGKWLFHGDGLFPRKRVSVGNNNP